MFSFYELCRNYQWTVEDDKVKLHFVTSALITSVGHQLVRNIYCAKVKTNVCLFSIDQVLTFYSSKHLKVDKHEVESTASEKFQSTYLSENELGFINILYGRYKIYNYSFSSLSLSL